MALRPKTEAELDELQTQTDKGGARLNRAISFDDIVIVSAVVLSLLIALFFAYSVSERGIEYPPTLISLFLGVCLCALIYRFLGGTEENAFAVGALKLGGSAAVLAGLTFVVGDRLREEMLILEEDKAYRDRIKFLDNALKERSADGQTSDGKVLALQNEIQRLKESPVALEIEALKKRPPDDDLVREIKRLVQSGAPPFQPVLREIEVRIAVVSFPKNGRQFTICGDTRAQLFENVDDASNGARVSRVAGEDGQPTSDQLEYGGAIDSNFCKKNERNYDVQIGCETALELFPDKIRSCAETSQIRSEKITIGALPG